MNEIPKRAARAFFVALTLGVAACGGSDSSGPGPSTVGPPASLTMVTGSGQEGPAGELLPIPLTVKAVDKDGKAVARALVTYVITAGGGSLSATLDTTDAEGVASVTWTLGSQLGDARVEARVTGVLAPVAFTANVKVGPPNAVERVSGVIGNTAAGFMVGDSVSVKVTDRFGHAIAGAPVAFTVTNGGGTVSSASKTTGADGVARIAWFVGAAGTQTLRASSGTFQVTLDATAVNCPETQMAIGEVLTILPGAAPCAVFGNTAQRYFVTVVNPTDSPTSSSIFRLRGAGSGTPPSGTIAAPVLSPSRQSPAIAAELAQLNAASARHGNLLRANLQLVERLAPTLRANARANANVAAPPLPTVGDVIDFKVPKNANNLCDGSTSTNPDIGTAQIKARVVHVGAHSIVLEDSSNPLAGNLDAMYTLVGNEFDNVMWPILNNNFGNPLAMDPQLNNIGRVYMVFSKTVNSMLQGGIAGFVSASDFFSVSSCPSSNLASVFYARVPTVAGTGFNQETAEAWYRSTRTIIVHEVKHVASIAERLSRGGVPIQGRDIWLEESTAMMAEELWARTIFGYGQHTNTDYASSIYCERRPTPSANWPQCQPPKPVSMIDHFFFAYDYLTKADTRSIVGSVHNQDFSFYGIGWLFLRWAIDTYAPSESGFLTALTRETALQGVRNVEARTGKSFTELLAEFSLAVALDDLPGFTPAHARQRITSWNTRNMFAQLSADFAGTQFFNEPAPLNVRRQSFGSFSLGQTPVSGGGMSVIEIAGTQNAKQLVEFKGFTGAEFPADLRISIVRVQ